MGSLYGQGNYGEGDYAFAATPLAGSLVANVAPYGSPIRARLFGGAIETSINAHGNFQRDLEFAATLTVEMPMKGDLGFAPNVWFGGKLEFEMNQRAYFGVEVTFAALLQVLPAFTAVPYLGPMWGQDAGTAPEWTPIERPDEIWSPVVSSWGPWEKSEG